MRNEVPSFLSGHSFPRLTFEVLLKRCYFSWVPYKNNILDDAVAHFNVVTPLSLCQDELSLTL